MVRFGNPFSDSKRDHGAKRIRWQEAVDLLNRFSDSAYWAARLPCAEDEKITEICKVYQRLCPKERVAFEKMITQEGYFILSTYSTRMAMLGARQKQGKWLVYGIVALTIGWTTPYIDWRETLMDLAPLYHSACIVGGPRRIFDEGVQHVDDERIRSLILDFLDRDPHDQSLEAMGWKVIEEPHGLIYRFDDQPVPEGHL